jgi:hypothetical protein
MKKTVKKSAKNKNTKGTVKSPLQETLAAVDLAALQTPQESDLPPLTVPLDFPSERTTTHVLASMFCNVT